MLIIMLLFQVCRKVCGQGITQDPTYVRIQFAFGVVLILIAWWHLIPYAL